MISWWWWSGSIKTPQKIAYLMVKNGFVWARNSFIKGIYNILNYYYYFNIEWMRWGCLIGKEPMERMIRANRDVCAHTQTINNIHILMERKKREKLVKFSHFLREGLENKSQKILCLFLSVHIQVFIFASIHGLEQHHRSDIQWIHDQATRTSIAKEY